MAKVKKKAPVYSLDNLDDVPDGQLIEVKPLGKFVATCDGFLFVAGKRKGVCLTNETLMRDLVESLEITVDTLEI